MKTLELTDAEYQERQRELLSSLSEWCGGLGAYSPSEVMRALLWGVSKLAFEAFRGDVDKGNKYRRRIGGEFWRVYMGLAKAHAGVGLGDRLPKRGGSSAPPAAGLRLVQGTSTSAKGKGN